MEKDSGIRKEYGAVTVDSVNPDKFKPNIASAQIRQVVTKIYPAATVGNSLSDNLFGTEQFDLGDGQSFEQTRVTWIPVPLGATKEQVQAMLDKCPDARIYQILSGEAILTEQQKAAIEAGLTSLEVFENSQMVKDSDGNAILDHNEELQYSAKFFAKAGKEDIDLRAPAAGHLSVNKMADTGEDLAI